MSILSNLNPAFKLEVETEYKVDGCDFGNLQLNVPFQLPSDYYELTKDFVGKAFYLENNKHISIWSISEVLSLSDDYNFSEYFPSGIPIGDNGGGYFYVYYKGEHGFGIYSVPYAPLDEDYADFVSKSLTDLLVDGNGIENMIL